MNEGKKILSHPSILCRISELFLVSDSMNVVHIEKPNFRKHPLCGIDRVGDISSWSVLYPYLCHPQYIHVIIMKLNSEKQWIGHPKVNYSTDQLIKPLGYFMSSKIFPWDWGFQGFSKSNSLLPPTEESLPKDKSNS